jgi:hypothetical protein
MQHIKAFLNKILQTSMPASSFMDFLTFDHFSNQTSAIVPSTQPESTLPTNHDVHPHSSALIMSRTPNGPRYGTFAGNGAEYASFLQVVMVESARHKNENLELKEQLRKLRATLQILLSTDRNVGYIRAVQWIGYSTCCN